MTRTTSVAGTKMESSSTAGRKQCAASVFVLLATTGSGFPLLSLAKDLPGGVRIDIPYVEQTVPVSKPRQEYEIYAPEGARRVPEAEKIKFALKDVVVGGGTVYTPDQLHAFYAELKGKEVSLADLYDVADRITRKYRVDGYLLSRAIVPEQRIKNGVVHLRLVEGVINNVHVSSPDGMGFLANMVDKEKILSSRPFSISVLERSLLLLRDTPGVDVQSLMRPAREEGAAELEINITLKRADASMLVDNFGTRYMGPVRTMFDVNANSLLEQGEHIGVTVGLLGDDFNAIANERELGFYRLRGDAPLGNDGLRVNASYLFTKANPGHTMADLEVNSGNRYWELGISYPIKRTRIENLRVEGFYRHNNLDTDILTQGFTKDRVRVIAASAAYDYADVMGGVNLFGVTWSQGIDHDGATQEGVTSSTRTEASPAFRKFNGEIIRDQNLGMIRSGLSLRLSALWQYTDEPLFSSEEFTVGGRIHGKGYDIGEIAGDRGISASAELHFSEQENDVLHDYYTFFDGGAVENLDNEDRGSEREERGIRSVGFGVKLRAGSGWMANFEFAKPLEQKPAAEADSDMRFFAQVGYDF